MVRVPETIRSAVAQAQACNAQVCPAPRVLTRAACPHVRKHVRHQARVPVSDQAAPVSDQVLPVSDQVLLGLVPVALPALVVAAVVQAAAVATQVAAAVVPVAAADSPAAVAVREDQAHQGEPSVDAAVVAPAVAQRVAANQSGRSVKSLTTWRHPLLVAPRFPWATGNQSLCLVELP